MKSGRRVRLVIDVNVLLAFLMRGKLAHMAEILADERFEVLTSREELAEFIDVIERPKFRKYFSLAEGRAAIADFCIVADLVPVDQPHPTVCRDPKDNYLLALAEAAVADVLITGDKDLRVLGAYLKTRILSPTDFRKAYL